MSHHFYYFIFTIVGAFVFWVIKGFRTSFKEELEDKHITRNIITTIVVVIILFVAYNRLESEDAADKPVHSKEETIPPWLKNNDD